MKRGSFFRLTLTLLSIAGCPVSARRAAGAAPPPDAAPWERVADAVARGLPRTAIAYLDPIIETALKHGEHAEAIRAISHRIALAAGIEGHKAEERIGLLANEILRSPEAMRPILLAIMANWHWHYFQQNRQRFMQRTATGEPPGADILTWDLPRIFSEIDRYFIAALSGRDRLRGTPIADYDPLLEKGTVPDRYRPTLYDFVVANALEFYSSGEQAAAKPRDAFVLSADSSIFASANEFMRWPIDTTDVSSPLYKAVRLYQEVMLFHRDGDRIDALLDWDLERLRFAYNLARGEEKKARYKTALRRFADRWSAHETSARARHAWASIVHGEGESVTAHAIATQGWHAFPDTLGGNLCFNLTRRIESKAATFQTERVWNKAGPTIDISYRNVTSVHFRVVAWDWEERLQTVPRAFPEQLDSHQRMALLQETPERTWSVALPPTNDFQEQITTVPAPDDLAPGAYFLLSSHTPDFGATDNIVSFTPVWVSDLALVMRTRHGSTTLEGLVLDAVSGDPIADAEIRAWIRRRWDSDFEPLADARTDADGLFQLVGETGSLHHLFLVRHGDQRLAVASGYSVQDIRPPQWPRDRAIFFTDRSIYRPGQTIQFKGIHIRMDQDQDTYTTIPDRPLTVVFRDVNRKEIERQQVRSNDYGSFSGSFTAPRDRLTGRMTISVIGVGGVATITIEEYKRPTFQTTLDAPETAPKLNDTVVLKGAAAAYTGAAVDGAQVRWRVVREMRYARWWYPRRGWLPPAPQASQEIAHGVTTTGADGGFTIEFFALPDPDAAGEGDPSFLYTVTADVTDAAGETRSAQRGVHVGYTALRATLATPDWLTAGAPLEIAIRTTTLDGVGQAAAGRLRVHRLEPPEQVQRTPLGPRSAPPMRTGRFAGETPEPDGSNPDTWPLGEAVFEGEVTTDPIGHAAATLALPIGLYRAVFDTRDRFGKAVRAKWPLRVIDPAADRLALRIPHLFSAPAWTVEPGEPFTAVWGSGYDTARALIEIEQRGEILQRYWTNPAVTQTIIEQAVTETLRGGFTVRVTMVRENRIYTEQRRVEVPWSNKTLSIAWERFVSKLEPNQKESWTAVISGPDARPAVAEMVATLYDQSLDAFLPHAWRSGFGVFRRDQSFRRPRFENQLVHLKRVTGSWRTEWRAATLRYRRFPPEITQNLWGHHSGSPVFMRSLYASHSASGRADPGEGISRYGGGMPPMDAVADMAPERSPPEPEPAADLDQVAARRLLNETAFFFPHLLATDDGDVRITFTMPETLTRWRFLGFAHDRELRAGLLTDSAVTAKDLMVRPNPPRFLREGDEVEFTVRVFNQSPERQTGTVRLTFSDARTGDPRDATLENERTDRAFEMASMESQTLAWRIKVPDRTAGILVYKAVGSSGRLSDGEEGYLPVLARRVWVTESLPLPIQGPATRTFRFDKLLESGASDTLESKTLTLQMVSNPSWYAVMALPYLMEYPYPCSEQIFNRLYANALARHIANADPKIRRVFDQWKGTDALDSPLEKNEDLKAVMLEETPWVRQAAKESATRRRVGILFDANRLDQEFNRALHQLTQQQLADGRWPWFPTGPPNDFMTLYIATGFGRLRHLGATVDMAPALRAVTRLDGWLDEIYRRILERKAEHGNHLSPMIALYLYGRSFFLQDRAIGDKHREAVDYFIEQARTHWLTLSHRQSQAHLALALQRFGDSAAAQPIMRSIRERAVTDEELGMFWRDPQPSWWWYRAPIETQAMMIEAFDEVMNDAEAVEACKVWLLRHKQTQHWRSTKATADAVYALLRRGADRLASDVLVEVTLADQIIEPPAIEAGTGYYERRFTGSAITPALGEITVRKLDEGVAWGSLHWQYLEDISKITPHTDTPLTVEKALYTRQTTARGPVLQPVRGPVAVGDELVARIVLRTDRDMEYVHLKDHRGSGTEPVNVLSGYRYQDGLRYYESTRDTASHFFIDYLPRGTYVFEYSVRVQLRGRYQTGMAAVQCMYAPEFNSHSRSIEMEVE